MTLNRRVVARFGGLMLLTVLVLSLAASSLSAQSDGPLPDYFNPTTNADDLSAIANRDGNVRVIIELNTDGGSLRSAVPFEQLSEPSQMQVIVSTQQALQATLPVGGYQVEVTFEFIPFIAMTVDPATLTALQNSPYVRTVALDGLNAPHMTDSLQQIDVSTPGGAWDMGFTGAGTTVAILDTGVDKNHEFLTGKVVTEACRSSSGSDFFATWSSLCPGGARSSNANNSGLNCTNSIEGCAHGTHVAGTAAGNDMGGGFAGVAKDANIMAVQVFSRVNSTFYCGSSSPCVLAFNSDVAAGLERVYKVRNEHNIVAANMSLGGGQYTSPSQCDNNSAIRSIKAAAQKLRQAKVGVIASSGNNGFNGAMGSPACLSAIVSVGSVNDFDQRDAFSNVDGNLDLYAPGSGIVSSVPGDNYASYNGTSMSAPHVAGAWGILREANPKANVNTVLKALRKTGVDVTGGGFTKRRIDVDDAILQIVLPEKPVITSPVDDLVVNTVPLTINWTVTEYTNDYVLKLKDQNNNTVFKAKPTVGECGGTCTVTITDALPDRKDITIVLKARNDNGATKAKKVTFSTDYPGKPVLESPADGATVTNMPTMSWSAIGLADDYKLIIKQVKGDGTKQKVWSEWYAPADTALACGGSCTLTVPTELTDKMKDGKTYEWRVMARNADGKSKSSKFTFTYSPGAPIAAPVVPSVGNERMTP